MTKNLSVFIADDTNFDLYAIQGYVLSNPEWKLVGSEFSNNPNTVVSRVGRLMPNLVLVAHNPQPVGIDGLQTARELKKARYSGKVVILARSITRREQINRFKANVSGYVFKGCDREAFIKSVSRILANCEKYTDPRFRLAGYFDEQDLSDSISPQQRMILLLSALNLKVEEIADIMHMCCSSISHHREIIRGKFGIKQRNFNIAVNFALKNGIITMEEALAAYSSYSMIQRAA